MRDERIQIVPERFTKVYYNWLENIEDWCISRQLWWGHRIPVWYCRECGQMTVARMDPAACGHCGSPQIEQDPDVLDTCFSSGLWPFSTLGWPEETPDYLYFYPTTMMETGYDILFFWVARMIMAGLEFTGQVPFSTVYLHGLIRDDHGRKVSKSYGNVIDPLTMMDELGTDTLGFTLLVGSTPGNDMNLSAKKVEANRNFANKIWNAGRFIISSLKQAPVEAAREPTWTLADSWIWARLQELIRDVETMRFHRYPRYVWVLAFCLGGVLHLLARLLTDPLLNVNAAFRVYEGWEPLFSSIVVYRVVTVAALGILFIVLTWINRTFTSLRGLQTRVD